MNLTISEIAKRWNVSVQSATETLKRAMATGLLTGGRKVQAGPLSCWLFEHEAFEKWEKIYRRG